MRCFLLVIALFFSGCASSDVAFYQASKATWAAVSPEYVVYVNADTTLSENERTLMLRTVKTYSQVLTERGKQIEKGD